jgi:hypothetical protein
MRNLERMGSQILAVVLLLSAAAMAVDPPSRVAQLQYISGEVSLQPGGVNDWVAGAINRPLTTADRLWTDKNSRAELHLGSAAMRVSAETSLTLTNLTDDTLQVELDQGTLNLRVRRLYHGETYEVDTPNLAFTIMKAGEYRLDVDPNGDTTLVTVWHGEGEATGEGRSVKVKGDRQARFTAGTSLAHQIYDAPNGDGFDDWCRVRDKRQDYSQSARYVSPDVIGAEDLDDYGTWQVVPTYGAIWVPRVAEGWAPYHYGHWAWVEPWGWTWIDDALWGFAPCHYGRWVSYSGYWAWVPGPVAVRPVYAPALVAWVGGSHFGVSLAIGGGSAVGWFPLGYGEPYLPPYAGSRNYFRNVNVSNTHITNITNITNNYYSTTNINSNNTNITKNTTTIVTNNNTNITKNTTTNIADNSIHINGDHNNLHIKYANQKVPGAVTAVPSTVLASSQPVAGAVVQVPAKELRETSIAVAPPVAPSKASVLGAKAGASTAVPPGQVGSHQVVRRAAAPPRPVPFSAKQEALANNPGRPLDRDTEDQLRTKIARQPPDTSGDVMVRRPLDAETRNTKSASDSSEKVVETPRPAPSTTVHTVPHPPVKPETNEAGTPASAERTAPEPPQGRFGPNAETSRPNHVVPRPPERPNVQKMATPASVENTIPRPPEDRPAINAEAPRVKDHSVPRPPEKSQVERLAVPASANRAVSQPPQDRPDVNAERSSAQDHAVPRPPERVNTPKPRYERVVNSPRAESRSVPQPPANSATTDRDSSQRNNGGVEPSPHDSHRSARPEQSKPDRERPTEGSGRPNAEQRIERPTPKAEVAPSGGRGLPPRASSTPPPPHVEHPKNSPRTDAPH